VAHQIALSFDFVDDANQAILVSRSTDEGEHWSQPIPLIADTDPNVVDDKESITADPHRSRNVYAVWDRLVLNPANPNLLLSGPALFSRTTDGGKTWEPARVLYDPGLDAQTIANQIVVLPNGDLVDLLVRLLHVNENSPDVNDVAVVVVRSTDRGVTWSAPIVVNTLQSVGVTDPKTGEPLRTGDIVPNIAVDPNGNGLHVVWQDARFSDGKRDGIAFATSHDNGLTWSAPRQINGAPNVQAFTASISVAEDGLAVTYYDLRNDNADPNVLLTDYWRTVSNNDGRTFHEKHLAGPFDMRTAPNAGGFFVGDYEGLANAHETFFPFFVMTNSGNLQNRTDVFVSVSEGEDGDHGHQGEMKVAGRSWLQRLAEHRESHRK
jgi:hypothetical protein